MATQTVLQTPLDRTLVLDAALHKLAVLKAMLTLTCGVGFQSFSELADESKDALLAGCFDLAHEVGTMLSDLCDAPQTAQRPA